MSAALDWLDWASLQWALHGDQIHDFIEARRNVLMLLCSLGFIWFLRRAKRKGWL